MQKNMKKLIQPTQCDFFACLLVTIEASSGFIFEIARRKSDFPTIRSGVKRNFWPIFVCQLFCFSEWRNIFWWL